MTVYFDPHKGVVDDQATVVGDQQMPMGLDPVGQKLWQDKQQYNQRIAAFEQGAAQGKNKPAFAQSTGQFFDELGNIAGNAITGLGTDYLDLAAGLGDVVVQAGSLATGKGWDWNQVMNDSDNPWTQWRQGQFESQTQAGELVNNVVRIGTLIATLPKVGIKGLALAPRLLSKAPVVGEAAGGIAKGLGALDDALSSSRAIRQTTQLTEAAAGFKKGSAAAKATKIAAADDWLGMTFKEVSKADEAKTWWRSVEDSTKALTQLTREKGRIRTVSEALAWDAFAAFNVYGEGDSSFDETFNDMLANAGLPNIPGLQTSVGDTGLLRKGKQMLEGVAMGALASAVLDMSRVYRYSQAFGKATPAEKELIIKAFNDEADDIGRSLSTPLLMPSAESLQAGRSAEFYANANFAQSKSLAELKAQVESGRIDNQYQNDLLTADIRYRSQVAAAQQGQLPSEPGQLDAAQLMANQQMVAGSQDALPGSTPAGLLPPGEVRQLPGAPEQAMLPGGPEAKPPGAPPAGLLGAGTDGLTAPIQPVQVQDITPRPPEPTVTPQTLRNAFYSDMRRVMEQAKQLTYKEGPDGVMRAVDEIRGSVKQLMPRTRVDAIEYLKMASPQANELGVIHAADSVWMNFITNRGLAEGWASIDPATMKVKFNRKSAIELDRGEAAMKQAEAMDELNSIELFKQRFADRVQGIEGQKQQLMGQMDEVSGLAERGRENGLQVPQQSGDEFLRDAEKSAATDAYDNWEADAAARDAERRAVTAGVEADQLNASEELRLSQAEQQALSGQLSDEAVVREYLGTTLDSVQAPEVGKAEVGRGWNVFGSDGEVIATTRTKREADKLAQAELRRNQEALLNRARQMEADSTDEAVNVVTGDPIYDSSVVGKVSLTEQQINAVQRYSQAIQGQLRADWEKRTGGQAWLNINDIKGSKRTFEMTQGEMYDLVDGIKALLQTGEITGPQARVLRNVADKMDTGMKLLEPQARAERFANDISADAQRFLNHGDFC